MKHLQLCVLLPNLFFFFEITNYCTTNLNMPYVLLGKLQTDNLESRFGQYRSIAGDQYHISMRQIHETESKLRFSKELKLASHSRGEINVNDFDISDNREDSTEDQIDVFFL